VPYIVAKKATLLVPSGPGENGQHLYVIVTNPCAEQQCLMVTMSSIKEGRFHDPACILAAGEHPFITKPSFIDYRLSWQVRCDHVVKCVDGWVYTSKTDVTDELFGKICGGIPASDFMPVRLYRYFEGNKHL